jgi:hypothetical protein
LQDEQGVKHRKHSSNGVLDYWSDGVLIRKCGSGYTRLPCLNKGDGGQAAAIKETSFRNPSPADIRNPGSSKQYWIPDLSFASSGMTKDARCALLKKALGQKGS